ncbi:hypothetical protein KW843_15850 [Acidovorax sp. sif1233]|jgi:hypothetical protein|uniref:hypothetical protein n=1 Tax=unclassified Acidovorax TaxID=2684926 RepID=UPI001C46B1AE|nr:MULTISPECIES: hypothetical protein [unclassified Acidovorax]MBV7428228.1 hypothetical protein [Acidovorax sp. sif0732]MBV7449485.1 hypothetical protein [Acidovorax sp. sif0715]MBV7455954.1 hypothetical protein [Acidovorax sp. sif1233]
MKTQQPRRRTEVRRLAVLCGTLGCALAWGLVELLALQRQRYHQWRQRHQTPAHR